MGKINKHHCDVDSSRGKGKGETLYFYLSSKSFLLLQAMYVYILYLGPSILSNKTNS